MADKGIEIGSRRELLIDDFLIERMDGMELKLQKPIPRQVAIVYDDPWEGNTCCYQTVFRDGDLYRMYYRGSHFDEETETATHPEVVCYAESRDGIHWEKPALGIVEFDGSKENNIVWDGYGSHNFTPFRDANPDCREGEEYKALAGNREEGLRAFKSPDGVHWELMRDEAVITEGAFDSQNLAFWDEVRGRYVDFHRHFQKVDEKGVRGIMTCTSDDFLNWTDPVWVEFPDAPLEQLYTNAVTAYFRAPHIFMGFPKRFVPDRSMEYHKHNGMSDAVFMTSRDGVHFKRWGEAFIRPGLQPERWVNRNNMTAWGIVETAAFLDNAPDELSIYTTEHYYRGEACKLRRFTVRPDGFVAANAPLNGGELVTRPLVFEGRQLAINYSTSVAGSVRVELQDADGQPIEGYSLEDADEIYGDEIERVVSWGEVKDVATLSGNPVRLRFVLKDADLFAFRFSG